MGDNLILKGVRWRRIAISPLYVYLNSMGCIIGNYERIRKTGQLLGLLST
jgi:hypothetical protein